MYFLFVERGADSKGVLEVGRLPQVMVSLNSAFHESLVVLHLFQFTIILGQLKFVALELIYEQHPQAKLEAVVLQ